MQEDKIPQQQGDIFADREKAERHAHFLIQTASSLTTPIRRSGGGVNSPGMPGMVATGTLFWWTFASGNTLCLWYTEAYVASLIVYRITRNKSVHSRYEGRPYLRFLVKNETLASLLEPVILLGLGAWIYGFIPVFAMIFLVSGAGCAIEEIIGWHQRRRMLIEYTDGQHMMHYQRSLYKRAGK